MHGIFGIDFFYNDLPDLKKEQDMENIAEILIDEFEQIENFDDIKRELENVNIYFKKCELMQKEIMKTISENHLINKEIMILKKNSENEIKQLKLSIDDYESDYNYILKEINLVETGMGNFKINENDDFDLYLKYIEELGIELGSSLLNSQGNDKKNMNEYVLYSKNVIREIKNLEDKVNEMISNIENIIVLGNKNEKELMEKIILKQKNINKKEKILLFKQKNEDLKITQKKKIVEREKKHILKGRMIIYDYPTGKIPKSKIKKNKVIKKDNNDESNSLKESVLFEQ